MLKRNHPTSLHAVAPDKLDKPGDADADSRHPVRVEFSHEHTRLLLILTLIIGALLLTWSWCTELDEIAQAPGQLIPSEEVQPVRAAFDSIVKDILVKSGDRVKKGDLLLRLDAKTYGVELDKFQHELKIASQELEHHQRAREILANYLREPRTLPPDLSGIVTVAKAIGDVFAAYQRLERAQLDASITAAAGNSMPEVAALKLQNESVAEQKSLKELSLAERRKQYLIEERKAATRITSLESQIDLQKTAVEQKRLSLEGTQKQLSAYEKVFKTGGSSKTECLDAKMRVEDRQKDFTMTLANLVQLQGQLETAKHELAELQSRNSVQLAQLEANLGEIAASSAQINARMRSAKKALSEAQTNYQIALRAAGSAQMKENSEISNLEKQIEQLKASLRAEQHVFQKSDVRSPVDGTVDLVNLQGAGEVVQREQNLLTIVPNKEKLVASLHVQNEYVPFLHEHEVVKLQFPAYSYQQYGTIPAEITNIDKFPSQEKEYKTTYTVQLTPMREWIMCRGKKIPLRKGLEVQAQLVLRKRRLLISILAPLLKAHYAHFKA